ncbi:MAG: dephospho-CoA kinase [Clostridia bacterium]|nr:dephospho-CoA kinase [Clostridia bacterium]
MKIAITGSIACGKSTVSDYLRKRGFYVADADAISRELTGPGSPVLDEIRKAFGDAVFSGDTLDRAALGSLVFNDPKLLRRLNRLLHPRILSELMTRLSAEEAKSAVVFAEVPLLYECGFESRFDRVWVVAADEETQVSRLFERNRLTRAEALARIHAQMPLSQKTEAADAVIRTDCPLDETYAQTDALLSSLPPASRKSPAPPRYTARRKKKTGFSGYWSSLPVWLKAVLTLSLSFVLLTGSVAIVRDYMARLEERRRLEAEAAERARHPLYHADLIRFYSETQDLDPALVSAVILCESSFDASAVSRLGARGLMQLMEDTAGWIAHKLGEDDARYSFDRLFDPETNIRFGTWYLRFLSDRFGGDPVKVVCAYHAGQGNVASWLSNPLYSPDGETLATIPTEDTALYCRRVLNARDVYKKYYFNEREETEDNAISE